MRIDIITCQPGLLAGPFSHSIVRRATSQGYVSIYIHDLRDYGLGSHRQIDDYAYGGEAGMVLMIEPIATCIEALQRVTKYDEVIYMTPDGECFRQSMANRLSLKENLILLCGHYKGIDERIREEFVTREISIGEYVLSGGELPAAVLVDSLVRLIPGALSDGSSALSDSYQDDLIAPPVYTRPASFREMEVPDVLLSGDRERIRAWRYEESLRRTEERAPHLLDRE